MGSPALSDVMLADGGCAEHIEAWHGETIFVVSGTDAGKTFTAVKEIEPDIILETDLGIDPRGKRVIRFRETQQIPNLASQDVVRTADGKTWNAVRKPGNQFLTVDFELKEIVNGLDT